MAGAPIRAAFGAMAFGLVCLLFAGDALARGGMPQSAAPLAHPSSQPFEPLIISFGLAIFVLIIAVAYLAQKDDAARLASQQRAEKFDSLINHMTQGLAAFDANGHMTFANLSYFQLYNLNPAEFHEGAHVREFLTARIRAGTFTGCVDAYLDDMHKDSEGGSIARRQIELPDGRSIAILRAPMPDGGWLTTHEDVTEQIRLRKDIQSTKEFLQSIIDKFPLGMSVIDVTTNKFVLVNQAGEKFSSPVTNDYVGHSLNEVFPAEIAAGIQARNDIALANPNEEYRVEFQTPHEGQPATILARRIVMNGEDGKAQFLLTILENVSEMRRLSREVEASKRFLEHIIDSLPISVVVKSADDLRYLLVNRVFEQLTGKTRDEVVGKRMNTFCGAEDSDSIEKFDRAAIAGVASARNIVSTYHAPDGKALSFRTQRHVIRDDNQKPEFLISLFEDVTEQKNLADEIKETKSFLEQIIDEIPVALLVKRVDDGVYVTCNRQAEKMINKPRNQVVGMCLDDVAGPMTIKDIAARDRVAIAMKGEVFTSEMPLIRKGQPSGLLMTRRVAIGDAQGKPKYLVTTYADVTDRRQSEQRLAYMAFHDALTRLPNRAAFVQSLEQMIDSCSQIEEKFAVISIDLDRFKEINDVCGHAFGDKLLIEVSKRIQAASMGAVVARLSGDEFGLIVDGEQPEAGKGLATRIVQSMKDEFEIDGQSVRASLTCGIAIYPDNGIDAAALLANADAALSRGKSNARGSIRFFEAEMDLQLREMRALHHDLASAMKNSELFLHYQPQAIAGLEIVGFESLIRWNHPVRGMVPPSAFIPIAEESGLIIELGEWILRDACREAASWQKPLQIAVNLSPAQFQHGDLVGLVHSILLETGLAPSRLELEITEGVLIRDFDRGLSLLRRLKALGVKIAMDDFGSGYSSLAYLQAFPFDKIKIDRDFVMNLGRNKQSAAIIRSVIGLGHGLNVPIVAEGVETKEQLQFLVDESCDQYQGYFIGRPNLISEFDEIIGREGEKSQKVSSVA